MSESLKKLNQNKGCLSWIFGMLRLFGIKTVDLKIDTTLTALEKIPPQTPHITCVEPSTFEYTDPSLVPSQPEYYVRHGGKNQSGYSGGDPRGG